jgi:hypothetical protein
VILDWLESSDVNERESRAVGNVGERTWTVAVIFICLIDRYLAFLLVISLSDLLL